jgi:tellurite resistance protein
MATHHATPLKFLAPGWFSVVMGLSGLTLAWVRAVPYAGDSAQVVAWVLGMSAALVMALLFALSLLRKLRHPQALLEDLHHPVRHVFVATFPVSLILLATVAHALGGDSALARVTWMIGSVSQIMVTVWVLSRWLNTGDGGKPAISFWTGITPALLIAVVGNVVVPLAGVRMGYPEWSAAQFGVGLFFWLVVLTLIFVRLGQQGMWPERLLPATVITIAPPSVIGLAALQLGAPVLVSWMAWGIAMFFLFWSASMLRRLRSTSFSVTFWALSFPLASLTALTLRLSEGAAGWFAAMAVLMLCLTSLLVTMLVFGTLRGLLNGTLLVPEPAPGSAPVFTAQSTHV